MLVVSNARLPPWLAGSLKEVKRDWEKFAVLEDRFHFWHVAKGHDLKHSREKQASKIVLRKKHGSRMNSSLRQNLQ